MKEIPLTKGLVAIVDDEDFEDLNRYKWYSDSRGYAARSTPRDANGKKRKLYMHRVILNPPTGLEVDHRNGNTSDNRRSNLRVATDLQNNWNQGVSRKNTSGFKGVHWHQRNKVFVAQIKRDGKKCHIGCFESASEAHAAYCVAAIHLRGEFAGVR